MDARNDRTWPEPVSPSWVSWPVNWSGIWVGALAGLAVALVTGLAGIALGAHLVEPGRQVVSWREVQFGGVIWAVCGAFLSFVVAGWVAGSIAGCRRAEPSMLHGAIAWLVAVPLLLVLAGLGAGGFFGAWYAGLGGQPAWAAVQPSTADTAEALAITRNNALGAVTALLLGLVGSVLGGWMASGEPMTLGYHNTRQREAPRVLTTTP